MRLPFFSRKSNRIHSIRHFEHVLGTSLEIQLVCDSESAASKAEATGLATIDRLEKVFNRYRPDSELNRWQSTLGSWQPVSADLGRVLAAAEEWRRRTNGAFLPTVESISQAWREGQEGERPDASESLWEVDFDSLRARRFTQSPASLNAIAKGYIIDQCAESMASLDGVFTAMVNIGGDIRHCGEGSAPVSITDPRLDAENAEPLERLRIANQGIATSGGYRRTFDVGGEKRSHLIDPGTGRPVERVLSCTIIAPSAMLADILSTSASVMPESDTVSFLNSIPEVEFLIMNSHGELTKKFISQNRS
jgi:thiamine biosynthesis lipoprotein ApbE